MKLPLSLGEIFIHFDEEEWKNLYLPPNCDRPLVKRAVQNALFDFRCAREVGFDYDLASLQGKVCATRDLVRDLEFLKRLALGNLEQLIGELCDIEAKINASIDVLEMEPKGSKSPGRKPDIVLGALLRRLVVIWKAAGGSVGGGAPEAGPGGPLIRFLRFTAGSIGVDLTAHKARGWIRRFQKEDLDDLVNRCQD
jgi:hypothetical protein